MTRECGPELRSIQQFRDGCIQQAAARKRKDCEAENGNRGRVPRKFVSLGPVSVDRLSRGTRSPLRQSRLTTRSQQAPCDREASRAPLDLGPSRSATDGFSGRGERRSSLPDETGLSTYFASQGLGQSVLANQSVVLHWRIRQSRERLSERHLRGIGQLPAMLGHSREKEPEPPFGTVTAGVSLSARTGPGRGTPYGSLRSSWRAWGPPTLLGRCRV